MACHRVCRFIASLSVAAVLVAAPAARGQDQGAPEYSPHSRAEGALTSVGSDTMVYLMSYWIVAFKRYHASVEARVLQAGSATAPTALLDGTANVGPMSRKMKDGEIQAFVKRHGYPPTEVRVAMDALAVYVNDDNPIPGMTLSQVDAAFSDTLKCGHADYVKSWDQLGLGDAWRRPIELFSRNVISGTYAFFAEHALCKGKFKRDVQMQHTSRDVVRAVAAAPGAIGYSGIGYLTAGVRAVPLADKEGAPFVSPTAENVYNGKYPLSRFLYIYVNKVPGKPLPPLEREFLRMVLSAQGQALVNNNGFVPLSPSIMHEELTKLD